MVSAWASGAAINVCGSILINLGTNIMKLGHNRRAASEMIIKPPIRTYKPWQLGVALFVLGNLLNFFSFGFAAQSLLAALGSIQFVSNVFFASLVLKEKVTGRVLVATLCIVCGCVVLVSFGNHDSQTLTVADMLSFYLSPVYVAFLVMLVLASTAFFFAYHYGQQKLAWMGREAIEDTWVKLLPVTYALFSGTIGTQSVLFCKTLSTLLRTSLAGDSQLQSWFFWLTFAFFLASASFWISRLNLALQLFPAIMIVPMMQISWTLFAILSGGIYFQEYKTLSTTQACGYSLGVMVVFLGVYLLVPGKAVYIRQFTDLEANLMLPRGDPGAAPSADLDVPPGHHLAARMSGDLGSSGGATDSQETHALLGGVLGGGGLKGLAGSAVERRQPATEEALPPRLALCAEERSGGPEGTSTTETAACRHECAECCGVAYDVLPAHQDDSRSAGLHRAGDSRLGSRWKCGRSDWSPRLELHDQISGAALLARPVQAIAV